MGFECHDISHLPALPSTLRDANYRIYAVKSTTPIQKPRRPQRSGTSLADAIADLERTPEGKAEVAAGRRWVGDALYAGEQQSLQAMRLKHGWSQAELAQRLQTTQARVSIYERGEEQPAFDMLVRMSETLEVDMNTLFSAIRHAATRRGARHAQHA